MTMTQFLIVALATTGLASCVVCVIATLYLIYCYRAIVPYERMTKRLLALEASQDELLRQIEVQRKSFAGVKSAAAKRRQPADNEPPDLDDDVVRDTLRQIAAAGGN